MDPNFKPYRTGMLMAKEKYPCGCTPKPIGSQPDNPQNLIRHERQDGALLCMISPSRAVCSSSSTGVSGVYYEKRRKKWRVQIGFKGKLHFLGYYSTKEGAIKARIEGERKSAEVFSFSRVPAGGRSPKSEFIKAETIGAKAIDPSTFRALFKPFAHPNWPPGTGLLF